MQTTKEFKERLSDETKDILKKNKVSLAIDRNAMEDKYSKRRFAHCSAGYDFLQNWFVARTYVQKKYSIDLQALELLLQLYPYPVFSQAEFSPLPKNYRYKRIKKLMKDGLVVMFMDSKKADQRLYTLSPRATASVRTLNKVLSGEIKYSEYKLRNPMASKEASTYDKKKYAIMKKLNLQPPNEKLKVLYE